MFKPNKKILYIIIALAISLCIYSILNNALSNLVSNKTVQEKEEKKNQVNEKSMVDIEKNSIVDDNKKAVADTLEMEIIAYAHAIKKFTQVSIDELNLKLNKDDSFFIYVGRVTCPDCRKIVPTLSNISLENEIEMFYLDSEETESNVAIKEFRNKYKISSVPTIIYFYDSQNYDFITFRLEDNIDEIKKQLGDKIKYYISK